MANSKSKGVCFRQRLCQEMLLTSTSSYVAFICTIILDVISALVSCIS
jgi:hypothetical protein